MSINIVMKISLTSFGSGAPLDLTQTITRDAFNYTDKEHIINEPYDGNDPIQLANKHGLFTRPVFSINYGKNIGDADFVPSLSRRNNWYWNCVNDTFKIATVSIQELIVLPNKNSLMQHLTSAYDFVILNETISESQIGFETVNLKTPQKDSASTSTTKIFRDYRNELEKFLNGLDHKEKIYFLINSNNKEVNRKFTKTLGVKVFHFDLFLLEAFYVNHHRRYKDFYPDAPELVDLDDQEYLDKYFHINKPRKAFSLNGRFRSWRSAGIRALMESGIWEYPECDYSYLESRPNRLNLSFFDGPGDVNWRYLVDKIQLPKNLDLGNTEEMYLYNNNIQRPTIDLIKNFKYRVVFESFLFTPQRIDEPQFIPDSYSDSALRSIIPGGFLTEKTYCGFVQGHPSIILCDSASREYLQNKGFYMFDEYIDYESVDSIAFDYIVEDGTDLNVMQYQMAQNYACQIGNIIKRDPNRTKNIREGVLKNFWMMRDPSVVLFPLYNLINRIWAAGQRIKN